MSTLRILLGTIVASLATVAAVVIFHNPSPAPTPKGPPRGTPLERLHLSAQDVPEDEILASPVVSYQSDTFGYTTPYHTRCTLDYRRSEFDGSILNAQ